MRIGFVGCGEISGAYLETLRQFPATEVVACADLDRALARAKAEAFAIPRTGSPEDVIGADDVELVLNLTPPLAHGLLAAVEGGVGLGGCHGGMCDSFRDGVEYQFMTGGQWVAHPGGDGVEYTVRIVDRDHVSRAGSTTSSSARSSTTCRSTRRTACSRSRAS